MSNYRDEAIENINERKRQLNKAEAAAAQKKREKVYNREVAKYEKELKLNPPGTVSGDMDKGLDRMGDTLRSIGKAFGNNRMTSQDDDEQMKARKDVKGYKKGGGVSSASSRADGCAMRGKTKGKIV
jgi:hypothetical protein